MADEIEVDSVAWAILTGFVFVDLTPQATLDNYDIERIRDAWAAIGHRIDDAHVHKNMVEIKKWLEKKPRSVWWKGD